MIFNTDNLVFDIKRYPTSKNNSLKPWNASDELAINYLNENSNLNSKITIANDSFGFLSTCLSNHTLNVIVNNKTQEESIVKNLAENKIKETNITLVKPLEDISTEVDFGLLKIPKGLDLFELYLNQIHKNISSDGTVICSFMTKYFTPQIIKIAAYYFEDIIQSKALKKARILILKKKKEIIEKELIHSIVYRDKIAKQYYGVFSSNNIDYATQFLIDAFKIDSTEKTILDLASGNGILAQVVLEQAPESNVHLVDDSYLAIASSKLNLKGTNSNFHQAYNLDSFQDDFFNLVISNPPFHFEYETNISVPLGMFSQVARCIKPTGRFLMVANRHLSYKKHLENRFNSVEIIAENSKFMVYECFEPIKK